MQGQGRNMSDPEIEFGPDLPCVYADLRFLSDDNRYVQEKPYYFAGSLGPGQEHLRTNLCYTNHTMQIRDLRGRHHELSIEKNGFEFIDYQMNVKFTKGADEPEKLRQYMSEVIQLVSKRLGAEDCICYSYRFRRTKQKNITAGIPAGTMSVPDQAAETLHTDHTIQGGPRRIRASLTEHDLQKYSNGNWRLRIVNTWAVLFEPVVDDPLTLCDGFTVQPEDLVAGDRISGDKSYVGEIYHIRHNPEQKWYYLSHQTPEELLLFVSYDSKEEFGPAFIPHGSFHDPTAPRDASPRESLELRLIVASAE